MDQTLVSEVMNDTPHLVESIATLRDAAKLMQHYECGALPVNDEGKLVGMITDRDIIIFGLAENKDPDSTLVEEVMNDEVYTCYPTDTLEHAADILAEQEVRRLIVVDKDDHIVGVVSMADMIKCTYQDAVNDNVVHHLFRYA